MTPPAAPQGPSPETDPILVASFVEAQRQFHAGAAETRQRDLDNARNERIANDPDYALREKAFQQMATERGLRSGQMRMDTGEPLIEALSAEEIYAMECEKAQKNLETLTLQNEVDALIEGIFEAYGTDVDRTEQTTSRLMQASNEKHGGKTTKITYPFTKIQAATNHTEHAMNFVDLFSKPIAIENEDPNDTSSVRYVVFRKKRGLGGYGDKPLESVGIEIYQGPLLDSANRGQADGASLQEILENGAELAKFDEESGLGEARFNTEAISQMRAKEIQPFGTTPRNTPEGKKAATAASIQIVNPELDMTLSLIKNVITEQEPIKPPNPEDEEPDQPLPGTPPPFNREDFVLEQAEFGFTLDEEHYPRSQFPESWARFDEHARKMSENGDAARAAAIQTYEDLRNRQDPTQS